MPLMPPIHKRLPNTSSFRIPALPSNPWIGRPPRIIHPPGNDQKNVVPRSYGPCPAYRLHVPAERTDSFTGRQRLSRELELGLVTLATSALSGIAELLASVVTGGGPSRQHRGTPSLCRALEPVSLSMPGAAVSASHRNRGCAVLRDGRHKSYTVLSNHGPRLGLRA
jgi:hypothetical protein